MKMHKLVFTGFADDLVLPESDSDEDNDIPKTALAIGKLFYFFFNPFPTKPWFLRVCSTSLLKTLREKEKLLVTSNFSFSHSVFYQFRELSTIFNKLETVVCKLFQFGRI